MAPQCPGKESSSWTCIQPCPGRTCCLFLCKAGPTLLLCPAAPSSQAQHLHPSPPPGSLQCPFWGPPDSVPPLPYPDSLPGGRLSPALLPPDWGLLAKHVPSESGSQPPCSPCSEPPPPLGWTPCPDCRRGMRRNQDAGAGKTPRGAGGETEAGNGRLEKPGF